MSGIGIWIMQGLAPEADVSCFVQPSQESSAAVEMRAGKRLVTLLNLQCRITNNALDKASWSKVAFGALASFLLGK
jgi:hypothetical protein